MRGESLSAGTLAVALVCALVLAVAGNDGDARAAGPEGGCEVGGEPALARAVQERTSPVIGGPVKGAIVIACGRAAGERIELVAARTARNLCVWLERPRPDWESSHSIVCKPDRTPWLGYCLPICAAAIFQEGPIKGSKLLRMVVGGAVPPATARVAVEFSRDGQRRAFRPLEAHVTDPELLRRLHQAEPFTVFGTVLRGCAPARAVRVLALDQAGAVTGAIRGQELFSNPCRLPF